MNNEVRGTQPVREVESEDERKILRERKVGRFTIEAASSAPAFAIGMAIGEVSMELVLNYNHLPINPIAAAGAVIAMSATNGFQAIRQEFGKIKT